MNILNMPGWKATGHTETKDEYRIEAVYEFDPAGCPKCQTLFDGNKLYRHGVQRQEVRDLPAHGKRVVVELSRKRYRCQSCHHTFPQPIPQVAERSQMTRRLAEWVAKESIRKTFTEIARETGLTNVTVRNVFDAYVAELDRKHKFVAPRQLGIDEVHLKRDARCVFTNLEARCVIGVFANRKKETVLAALR